MAVRLKDRIEANIRQSDKVNSSLSIQLNSGTATVYDGSAAKSINVTPVAIGAPTTGGVGATGTWNINITGNAATASQVNGVIPEWAGSVSWDDTSWIAAWNADGTKIKALNKNSFAPASHSHSYLPLSGGTLTGIVNIANGNRWPQLGFATNDNGTIKHIGLLYMDDGSDVANEMSQSVMAFRAYSWNSSTKRRNDYYEDFYLRASADITAIKGYDIFSTKNYTSYVPTKTGTGASGTWGINITGNAATSTLATGIKDSGDGRTLYMNYSAAGMSSTSWLGSWNGNTLQAIAPSVLSVGSAGCLVTRSDVTYGWNGLQYFNASLGTTASSSSNYAPTADWYHIIRMNHGNANGYYVELAACFHNDNFYFRRVASGTNSGFKHIWVEGNSVTSAVWNDYAEYRESDCQEFGRVLMENGDDSLSVSTKRLQPFAGISSDTWGFCQGETEKAKTPIAVAGRVLAYPYQNRNNYKPGDCVCAAPNGTVDIMTRQEVIQYPDRIVGTVSCIPDYEEWGQGDRPAVKVDGRIWIKVR